MKLKPAFLWRPCRKWVGSTFCGTIEGVDLWWIPTSIFSARPMWVLVSETGGSSLWPTPMEPPSWGSYKQHRGAIKHAMALEHLLL